MPLAFKLAKQLMEQAEDEGTEAQAPEIKSVSASERDQLQSSSSLHKVQLQYHGHNKPASIPGMQGGDGEGSYTRSSRSQGALIPLLQRMLGEAISELNLSIETTYRVADFGCAVGANTLSFAHFNAESLKKRCAAQSTETPEVQCFFADLPTNDFNTLFQQFPVRHLDGDHAAKVDGESHKSVIEPEVRDSFNKPLFFPSQEEIREAIEATSAFHIKQLEFRDDGVILPEEVQTKIFEDPQVFEQYGGNIIRSVYKPLLEACLGHERAEKLFEIAGKKLAAEWTALVPTLTKFPGLSFCVAVLVKKLKHVGQKLHELCCAGSGSRLSIQSFLSRDSCIVSAFQAVPRVLL